MMSIQVKGGQAEAFKLVAGLKLFSHATSLGGTHSLIEHRASVEGPTPAAPQIYCACRSAWNILTI